ncbi:hypothetical protein [Natrinema salinisoli]|uniref:hypothetical protein n=1 Tax=Natrinema salinisoli TaxID=2878535 RepID=UPI001CF0176C|nr:hypothetical protein [Natrinema salinisoli]
MPHNLAQGKRDQLSLELVEFDLWEVSNERGNRRMMGWEHDEIGIARFEAIERSLESIYQKEREEHVGDILELEEDVIVHIYDTDGVIIVEDYNLGRATVELEAKHVDAFLEGTTTLDQDPTWEDEEIKLSTVD